MLDSIRQESRPAQGLATSHGHDSQWLTNPVDQVGNGEIMRVPRILIVEDQYVAALDCEGELVRAGFETVGIASTAAEAYLLAGRERPDLVLMDIRLASRADGVETAREIYEQYGIRSLFVTAQITNEVREQAQAANPVGWISKPYDSADLVQGVKSALDQILPASSS